MNLFTKLDWTQGVTIISFVLIIIGWFTNQYLNRKNEIAKEARGHRLTMLQSYMNLIFKMEQMNVSRQNLNDLPKIPSVSRWEAVRVRFATYGKNDENRLYEELMKLVYEFLFFDEYLIEEAIYSDVPSLHPNDAEEADLRYKKLLKTAHFLRDFCANRIRKELNIEKIKENNA